MRDDLAAPRKGRLARRRSLLYFAQLSDFQLADEESPARAEVLDLRGSPFEAAWRPQEALEPFIVDEVVRQVNRFDAQPDPQPQAPPRAPGAVDHDRRLGRQPADQRDVKWVVRLLEGGRLDPNSGVEGGVCGALAGATRRGRALHRRAGRRRTCSSPGASMTPTARRARSPRGRAYPGLMDRAQVPFEAAGLKRPSYVALGNHDGTVQGNIHALEALDDVARGCVKPLAAIAGAPSLSALLTSPARSIVVPPDPARGFADRPTYKALHATGRQADAHGFGHVDPAELAASRGQAAYYAFSPKPGCA